MLLKYNLLVMTYGLQTCLQLPLRAHGLEHIPTCKPAAINVNNAPPIDVPLAMGTNRWLTQRYALQVLRHFNID
jgi:hypothetical protein